MIIQKRNSRVKIKLKKKKNRLLNSGLYGFKVIKPVELNQKHVEIMENIIKKATGKKAKIHVKLLYNKMKTKKPDKIRMGKGKGAINEYVSQVIPGQIFLELNNVTRNQAFNSFKKVKRKFQIEMKLISH